MEKLTGNISKFKKEIEAEEEKYEFLFNKINDAVYLTHYKAGKGFGKFKKVNNKACQMLNYSREELLKMTAADIDKKLSEKNKNKDFLKKFLNKKNARFETEHITKEGKKIFVEVNSHRYKVNNETYILSIARDITERKKTEKDLLINELQLQKSNQQLEAHNEEISAMNEELVSSYQELDKLANNLENMIDLVSNLKKLDDEDDFLSNVLKAAVKIIPEANYGKICLYRQNKVVFVDAVGHNINLLQQLDLSTEFIADKNIKNPRKINNYSILDLDKTPEQIVKKFKDAVKPISQSLFINLKVKDEFVGRIALDIGCHNEQKFSNNSIRLLKSLESLASSHLTLERYNKLQERFIKDLIISITNILELYDRYTSGHSNNVAEISAQIADEMGLTRQEISDIYWAGLVHDIGKLLIPLDILNKKGRLEESEYELIKKHPVWGYKALSQSDFLIHIPELVLHHHERWDGQGYPDGLQGNDIPLASQILTVADAWDAMTSRRAYRDAMSKNDALNEIIKNKGKQFSPEVVEAFLNLYNYVEQEREHDENK